MTRKQILSKEELIKAKIIYRRTYLLFELSFFAMSSSVFRKYSENKYTYICKIVAMCYAICTDRFNPLYIKVKGVKNLLSVECILIAYSAYLCTTASR